MALELDGQQRRRLREALIDAFPGWNPMNRLLSDQLDERLAVVVGQGNDLETVAFELIEWARARGLLGDLVIASRNQNPGNPKLEVLAKSLGLSSTDARKSTLEKVVSANSTFLDVAKWRAELTRSEWRVARVDRDGDGVGTGFLVGPDLLLTNHHVVQTLLKDPAQASRWSCRFDHKLAETGDVIAMGRVVKLADDWRIDDSPYSRVDTVPDPKPHDPGDDELDFALLRLAEPAGDQGVGKGEEAEQRRWVRIAAGDVDYAATRVVAILQHPRTLPLKLALGMEQQLTLNGAGNRVRHTVPTEPGSSGSPLFDGDWRLIALHHAGDPATVKPEFNEAIPIAKITAREKVAAALPEDEE